MSWETLLEGSILGVNVAILVTLRWGQRRIVHACIARTPEEFAHLEEHGL